MKKRYIIQCFEDKKVYCQLIKIHGGKVITAKRSPDYIYVNVYNITYESEHDISNAINEDYDKYYRTLCVITPPF